MPRIPRRPERRSLALIPSPASPEMCLACPSAPLGRGLMPFIVDDAFYDDPEVWGLPDCAVAFLMFAGPWSARNNYSGFIPARVLARFSSDPELVAKALQEARFLEPAGDGWRIAEGRLLTVVNASDAAAAAAEQQTSDDAERAAKSAGGKLGNHERWHEKRGVRAPGCEFCEVTSPATANPAKRASHSDRIRSVSDSDATPIDRSGSDQDLSIVRPQQLPVLDARTRKAKPGTPEFRLHVIAAFAAATRIDIGTDVADAIASDVLDGRKGVGQRLPYVLAAIRQETDPVSRWLSGHARPEPVKPAAPEWCGECDQIDRTRENEHGKVYACPECSPKSFAAHVAKGAAA